MFYFAIRGVGVLPTVPGLYFLSATSVDPANSTRLGLEEFSWAFPFQSRMEILQL